MKIGDIILVPFIFSDYSGVKVRPSVIITETEDKYCDLVVSAISSVVPAFLTKREILIKPNNINNLRTDSIIKVDRIVTVKKEDKIADLGKLSDNELATFRSVLNDIINS